jgi:hypothetical protein
VWSVALLPRTMRGGEDFADTQALHSAPELRAVDSVAIAEQIRGRQVVREGIHDLLGRPRGGRVLGHVEVDNAPDGERARRERKAPVGQRGQARTSRSNTRRRPARRARVRIMAT